MFQNHRVIFRTMPTNGAATVTFRSDLEARTFAKKNSGIYQAQNMRGEWKTIEASAVDCRTGIMPFVL